MKIIRYLIADDHKIFRQGLRLVLGNDKQLLCAGEAENGAELLRLIEHEKPDLVLLDLKMPVMEGAEAARIIREKYPEVRILVLTMHDEEQFILHLIESGANGYLLKSADPEEIIQAIYSVCENRYYFNDLVSQAMLRKIVHHKDVNPSFNAAANLNEKEINILRLICDGFTAAEIADKVFLSSRTVEGIRATMMEKVGVRNIAGLVMYAVRSGLVK